MQCPRDGSELQAELNKGIEVDRCATCNGLWLDYPELDQLEDTILDDDHIKGTMIYSPRPAGINCPNCGEEMTAFYYRANSLELDVCGKHGHGFWLDHGEDREVIGFMKQRIKDLQRSASAEVQWNRFLAQSSRRREGGGLIGGIKRFFTGK